LKFCAKCLLLVNIVTDNLVTSPKITASLRHSVYVTEDGKVIKLKRLNKFQFTA